MLWNRVDIARNNIFSGPGKWTVSQLFPLDTGKYNACTTGPWCFKY